MAAETQNEMSLRAILDENLSLMNQRGYKENTVLIFIAQWGHHEILLVLLEYGPDLNLSNEDGDTALIVASRKGHYDLCVDLIQAGALLDVQNKLGRTALMEACCYGHLYVVQLLIYADADHQLTDRNGSSALIHSSLWGHRDIVNELVSHGAKLGERHYLPQEFQGNKLEAKIKLKQRLLARKVPEEERVRRQRMLIEKYYSELTEEEGREGKGS